MRLKLLRSAVDITVTDDIDVIITEGAAVTVRLPPATAAGNGRAITVRAFGGRASIIASGGDVIDSRTTHALDRGEMITLINNGGGRWIIISSSDL